MTSTLRLNSLRQMAAELPRTFWLLWLGTLINRVGIFVAPFLTLFLTRERGFTIPEAAFVVSMMGFGGFLAQFIGGYCTDRFGRRPTLLISLLGTPILVLLLSVPGSHNQLLVTAFLLGLFTDMYRPAGAALIADVVPLSLRPRAYALRYWANNLGASLGLALGGLLASQNFLFLFIGDALTTFLFGLVIFFGVRETRTPKRQTAPATQTGPFWRHWSIPVAERGLLIFVLCFSGTLLLDRIVYGQSETMLALDMTQKGLTEADYGAVLSLNGLLIVFFSLPLNHRLSRWPRFHVLALSSVLMGLGMGLNALATTIPFFALNVIIWTVGEMIAAPLGATIMSELAPPEQRGFYQGLLGASWGLASFITPNLGSAIFTNASPQALWLSCVFFCAGATVLHLTINGPIYNRLRHTDQ
jgi:MFS family permease